MITLFIRDFGRGTDFICHDDDVTSNGGVAVIQAFFSIDKSEEIQIKGRTARQSQDGQYYLIMQSKDLIEDLKIEEAKIKEMKKFQNTIYD